MHLSVALENSTLRRILSFLLPSRQVSLQLCVSPGLFDAIGWFTDEELVEKVEVRFIAMGVDFATILSSFFLFLCPLRHRLRAAYQSWNSQRSK